MACGGGGHRGRRRSVGRSGGAGGRRHRRSIGRRTGGRWRASHPGGEMCGGVQAGQSPFMCRRAGSSGGRACGEPGAGARPCHRWPRTRRRHCSTTWTSSSLRSSAAWRPPVSGAPRRRRPHDAAPASRRSARVVRVREMERKGIRERGSCGHGWAREKYSWVVVGPGFGVVCAMSSIQVTIYLSRSTQP